MKLLYRQIVWAIFVVMLIPCAMLIASCGKRTDLIGGTSDISISLLPSEESQIPDSIPFDSGIMSLPTGGSQEGQDSIPDMSILLTPLDETQKTHDIAPDTGGILQSSYEEQETPIRAPDICVGDQLTNEKSSFVYCNSEMNFSLSLPESWKSRYVTRAQTRFLSRSYSGIEIPNEMGVRFEYISDLGEPRNGWLFTIYVIDAFGWDEDMTEGLPIGKLYENDNIVYYLLSPTQFSFDPRDERERKSAIEYQEMLLEIDEVLESFVAY